MNPDQLIATVSNIGRILLESGAEVYRVEGTMVRIAETFPIEHVESFVTPTVVMLSITYGGQVYSSLIRIKQRNTDLNRIDCINSLSRDCAIHPISIDELDLRLNEIVKEDDYPHYQKIIFAGLVGFSFALLFKGSIGDAVIAFLVSTSCKILSYVLETIDIKGFLNNTLSSAMIMLCALLAVKYLPFALNVDTIVISSIMLLVPGIEFTNAIRDTLAGDYLSGISRGMEAILVAISLAVGCGIVLSVWMNVVGVL